MQTPATFLEGNLIRIFLQLLHSKLTHLQKPILRIKADKDVYICKNVHCGLFTIAKTGKEGLLIVEWPNNK